MASSSTDGIDLENGSNDDENVDEDDNNKCWQTEESVVAEGSCQTDCL